VQRLLHPIHAALLSGTVPLFLGVLLSDVAYALSYELQWKNFASWLIVGGLVYAGVALLGALIDLRPAGLRQPGPATYFVLLLVAWILGFLNALVHAKDAWASMPTGLILSFIVASLAILATALGFSRPRAQATT
jgi:uncharacterized membrane protein